MKKLIAFLFVGSCTTVLAATYTVPAGSSATAIQAIVNMAGNASGNTVMFSAGTYSLNTSINLPCGNGTIYTGPNVGVVTVANKPSAVLTSTDPSNIALTTNSNGIYFTGSQGCTIQFLDFSGTQGGIYVTHPASGIVIQYNYFTLNNPPVGGWYSQQAIYLDGDQETTVSAEYGVSYITIVWNVFYNNCALINAEGGGNGNVDSGGYCDATMVSAYDNYLVWSNNTVDVIEEGLKFLQQSSGTTPVSLNADVENNNLQGNSRIMIESQIDTNGVGTYSHNAFYNPKNPNNGTFELSMPLDDVSIPTTHTADDNVYIGAVPITGETGYGAHYGIGLEIWGPGSIASNSLYQGGNGPETCGAGYGCSAWVISVGGLTTNANVTGNYFSGTDVWTGTPSGMDNAITYEDGASASNAGLVLDDNTVAQTSATIPTVAPKISSVVSANGEKVTITDSDTQHRLSFFYTRDGSTPAIFTPGGSAGTTQVYTWPFTVPAGTTIKAIASWGQGANQGIVFPVFGYVPSSVVTSGGVTPARSIKSVALHPKAGSSSITVGSTLQMVALATYSDGTTGALPDAAGNQVTSWSSTNHKVAVVSTKGHATATNPGLVSIGGMIGSLAATPLAVTVSSGGTDAVSAAAVAMATATVPDAAATVSDAASTVPAAASTVPAAAAASVPAAASAVPAGQLPVKASGPAPAALAGPLPDNFVGPFWTVVSPNGGSASISNAHLFLGVPGGANHDAFSPSNQALRVVQAIGNENFDVAIKIDSALVPTDGNTSQGLMALSGNEDFITFALTTDGTRVGLKASAVTAGVATIVLDDSAFSEYQNPTYLRLTRTGTAYVASYSVDGSKWTQASSFTNSIAATSIGPFASNYSDTPANAVPVVMSVNWFEAQ